MKAARYHRFGEPEVLVLEELEMPVPEDDEIVVEVYTTTVNSGDYHLRSGKPFMARIFAGPFTPRNKVLGSTVSGKVARVGHNVKKYKIGDEVFASLGMNSGSYAEYVKLSEDDTIAFKPQNISHEEAVSLVFGGLNAKYFLEKADIARDKKVLIIGAAGGVGSYAVQLAKYYGAHVSAVTSSATSHFVKNLGADIIIDYKKEDISEKQNEYDLIFDMVSNTPISKVKSMLKKDGSYITTVANFSVIIGGLFASKKGKQLIFDLSKSDKLDLEFICDLTTQGIIRPLISEIFELKDISDAHRYLKENIKNGAVVVKVK